MDKSLKTVGDVAEKGKTVLECIRKADICDWRPASDMYINDYVKLISYYDHIWPKIPGGILFELSNGDKIIYINHDIASIETKGGNYING